MNMLCAIAGHRHSDELAKIQPDRHWHSRCVRCRTPLIKVPHGWIKVAAPR